MVGSFLGRIAGTPAWKQIECTNCWPPRPVIDLNLFSQLPNSRMHVAEWPDPSTMYPVVAGASSHQQSANPAVNPSSLSCRVALSIGIVAVPRKCGRSGMQSARPGPHSRAPLGSVLVPKVAAPALPCNPERVLGGPKGKRPKVRSLLKDWSKWSRQTVRLAPGQGKYAVYRRLSAHRPGRKRNQGRSTSTRKDAGYTRWARPGSSFRQ
jgi:hypothetical protein